METKTKETNHAEQNARGWSETIVALVGALQVDFDRLEELRDERASLVDDIASITEEGEERGAAERALMAWDDEYGQELRELEACASVDGELFACTDDVTARIQESPLSVQVRSGWVNPGDKMEAEDFEVLLSTGGPALRIMGELDEHKQPRRAWLEYQDWGTPWTEFHGEGAPSQDTLVEFCSQFYFGE